ncbi:hypothetical protein GYMLUDRAFT_995150 [Collybiopsis luxurians FD-317 M1]|uniref:F-box domain-containing protein n=1 Tax=Collybiopsis luxurians FD-317 M1 TaxID=944289 RepID=A0A0D0C2E9_9AGAR|nr:hypothetical protein GYMLUDRAFT_995150 [Collybiopsis luxurians FD-317 M1]
MPNIVPRIFSADRFHEVAASPVHQLPTELLEIIFAFCRPESPLRRRFDGPVSPIMLPDASEFPALYVNKQWRATAISLLKLAPLPVFLDLYLPAHEDIRVRNQIKSMILHRLEKYLSATSPNPISFSIHDWKLDVDERTLTMSQRLDPETLSLHTTSILNLLCEHSYRWEDATLHLPPPVFHNIRNNLKALPNLKLLELRDAGVRGFWRIITGGRAALPSFMEAKQLSSLTLNASLLQEPNLMLPWSQLVNLTLTFSNPRYFHFILNHCTNLVDCKLMDYDNSTDRWTAPDTPVLHFALRRLWLKNCILSRFLPLLHAPNLEELYVEGVAISRPEDVQNISIAVPFIERLHINFISFYAPTGLATLEWVSAPTLILEMLGDMPGRAFDILEKKTGVRHLHLRFRETDDEAALLRMVKARMEKPSDLGYSTSRLHSFHPEACLSNEVVEELHMLSRSGLAIFGLEKCAQKRLKLETKQRRNVFFEGVGIVVRLAMKALLKVVT